MKKASHLRKRSIEFYYKDDELGDPLLTEDHIEELELASKEDVAILKEKAQEISISLNILL